MSRVVDRTGERFGRLTVLQLSHINGSAHWKCLCDCGNIKITSGDSLKSGATKSCGCIVKELNKQMRIDLTGKNFGKLTVLGISPLHKNERVTWVCQCECGNIKHINSNSLRAGRSNSCGCMVKKSRTSHGMYKSREISSWSAMKQRCTSPTAREYARYGGRGITVCERWMKFENFLEDMGHRPLNTTLDRINNNGNYEPGNCRWATSKEQNSNTRRNVNIPFNGKIQNMRQWSDELNIPYNRFCGLYRRGITDIAQIIIEHEKISNSKRNQAKPPKRIRKQLNHYYN